MLATTIKCNWLGCQSATLFFSEEQIFEHIILEHATEGKQVCKYLNAEKESICNAHCRHRGYFTDHVVSHFSYNLRPLKCNYCPQTYRNRQDKRRHENKCLVQSAECKKLNTYQERLKTEKIRKPNPPYQVPKRRDNINSDITTSSEEDSNSSLQSQNIPSFNRFLTTSQDKLLEQKSQDQLKTTFSLIKTEFQEEPSKWKNKKFLYDTSEIGSSNIETFISAKNTATLSTYSLSLSENSDINLNSPYPVTNFQNCSQLPFSTQNSNRLPVSSPSNLPVAGDLPSQPLKSPLSTSEAEFGTSFQVCCPQSHTYVSVVNSNQFFDHSSNSIKNKAPDKYKSVNFG
ncbi:hypothetical protein HDU92_008693 [Lobulomyces angularis]|nr:hypothetical protein HDU92_008693 [Lobulomyces angularis]